MAKDYGSSVGRSVGRAIGKAAVGVVFKPRRRRRVQATVARSQAGGCSGSGAFIMVSAARISRCNARWSLVCADCGAEPASGCTRASANDAVSCGSILVVLVAGYLRIQRADNLARKREVGQQ
jgi:hypothetical protein